MPLPPRVTYPLLTSRIECATQSFVRAEAAVQTLCLVQ